MNLNAAVIGRGLDGVRARTLLLEFHFEIERFDGARERDGLAVEVDLGAVGRFHVGELQSL